MVASQRSACRLARCQQFSYTACPRESHNRTCTASWLPRSELAGLGTGCQLHETGVREKLLICSMYPFNYPTAILVLQISTAMFKWYPQKAVYVSKITVVWKEELSATVNAVSEEKRDVKWSLRHTTFHFFTSSDWKRLEVCKRGILGFNWFSPWLFCSHTLRNFCISAARNHHS